MASGWNLCDEMSLRSDLTHHGRTFTDEFTMIDNTNALTGPQLYELAMAAPFPPSHLMQRVSGLTSERDFAKHGCDLFDALSSAAPKPLFEFRSILDFGVGSGRLARMFKNFEGAYYGVDVDHELVDWVASALPWVVAFATEPRAALP